MLSSLDRVPQLGCTIMVAKANHGFGNCEGMHQSIQKIERADKICREKQADHACVWGFGLAS